MPDQFQLVEGGPSFTPQRYGLLQTAERPVALPEGWLHGTVRLQRVCGPALSYAVIPCTGAGMAPTGMGLPGEGTTFPASDVFAVAAAEPCSPVGWGDDLAELRARAEQRLTDGEGRAVERVFWTGVASDGSTVYPHLAADADVDAGSAMGSVTPQRQMAAEEVTTAAVHPAEALGELEGYLGECYGGEAIIHVPRSAVAHLARHGLVRPDGQLLRTLAGNRVATYSGGAYPGPDGVAPAAGDAWFYGTGMVQVLRSDALIDLGRSPGVIVGRDQNTFYYVVYRTYSVTFDCCLGAAQVEVSAP